jgi:predicted dithiol-disulfide oxidoreductase (DUF899 family)
MQHAIVSREEWLAARKQHLAKEKELTRLRDKLSAERRELPWVKVEKEYVFDAPEGKATLADLFDSRSQLIVHHFMLGPGWDAARGNELVDSTYMLLDMTPMGRNETGPYHNLMDWVRRHDEYEPAPASAARVST